MRPIWSKAGQGALQLENVSAQRHFLSVQIAPIATMILAGSVALPAFKPHHCGGVDETRRPASAGEQGLFFPVGGLDGVNGSLTRITVAFLCVSTKGPRRRCLIAGGAFLWPGNTEPRRPANAGERGFSFAERTRTALRGCSVTLPTFCLAPFPHFSAHHGAPSAHS